MTESEPPPDAAAIEAAVDRAIGDTELEPDEAASVLGYANRELSSLLTPEQTYFVLGSYREPFIRRLRTVQDDLNARIGAYAFVLGDLPPLETPRLPTFELRFHLVASYADTIVGVYEQDAGGEVTELGKISDPPYFSKSYVLPRDYHWPDDEAGTEPELIAAVVEAIHENADDRISRLVADSSVEMDEATARAAAQSRLDADSDLPSYSWVHRNAFRTFEIHGRCFPWVAVEQLRDQVSEIP